MKYLEDYLSENIITVRNDRLVIPVMHKFAFEIAKICDDDMYINSTLGAFDNDDQAKELLDYLNDHPDATRCDIDYCTVRIYNKYHNIY